MATWLVITLILILFMLVVLSAFFSAAETAYSSVSQSKILRNSKKGKKSAKLIEKHYSSFGSVLSTILIANNLVNILSTTLITFLLASFVSSGNATIISTAVMTPIIVVFGEIIPKLYAKKYAYGYLVKIVYIMEVLNWIFLPFTFLLKKFTLKGKVTNTESDLKTYISIASEEGVLEKREATLAKNSLDLDSTMLKEILTPIKDVVSIDHKATSANALKIFKKSGHSRLPVSQNGKYIGLVLLKDLVFSKNKTISKHIIKATTLKSSLMATKALEMIRLNSSHMVFIAGTNGKIVGILTLEDIIEELIGEIYDEHDSATLINQITLHKFHALPNSMILELGKEMSITFEGALENQTVKQWLNERITRSMKKNLVYIYKNKTKFKVIENSKKTGTKIEVIQR